MTTWKRNRSQQQQQQQLLLHCVSSSYEIILFVLRSRSRRPLPATTLLLVEGQDVCLSSPSSVDIMNDQTAAYTIQRFNDER
mmetsp:Transcript_14997/g.16857  ORF Transcript_14997/g.16857 Transcript_14997/m.16857 type:complete len:82 (-) Transcript_14997:15-260(-)